MAEQKFNFYEYTTDKIRAEIQKAIEGDKILPWQRPYKTMGRLMNYNSKRPYRGWINQMVLHLAGYEQPYWATYRGWRETAYRQWAKKNGVKIEDADIKSACSKRGRFEKWVDWLARQTENTQAFFAAGGGGVHKDELQNSQKVFFWLVKPNDKHDESDPNSRAFFFIQKVYNVWNIEQCENVEPPDEGEFGDFEENEIAENIWSDWEDKPDIVYGSQCSYNRKDDVIGMVKEESFRSAEHFYAALFHEGAHATGHKSRLNRAELNDAKFGFGSDPYCKEELTAEMSAAILCGMCGMERETEPNTVAYLKGWYERLGADPKLLVSASTKAAKACDLILGVKYDNGDGDAE